MKSKPQLNRHGLKLEYNPNNAADLKLAIEIAREWHCRGASENQLVAAIANRTLDLQQAA